MLYVLLSLVVALALVSGAEYAMLRIVKAERKAEVAELKNTNYSLTKKCMFLSEENKELSARMVSLEGIKEGLS